MQKTRLCGSVGILSGAVELASKWAWLVQQAWCLGGSWGEQNAYVEGRRVGLPSGPWCARGNGTMQV